MLNSSFKLVLLFSLLSAILRSNAQIVINEICPRNALSFIDEDGEYPDWFELYNNGEETVSLLNWSVSDNPEEPDKWKFPDVSLQPDSFMTVFASNKNRKAIVNHWETAIYADDIWKYLFATEEPDPDWKEPGFDDSSWLEGQGGFGRGDGDDNTIMPDTVPTVYIRKTFTIPDTSIISYVLLHVDYDDAFVAYLNGVEIARANIGYEGKIQKWNDWAWVAHPAQMFQGGKPDEFRIDMELFKSNVHNGENLLAIQGLNAWNNYGNSSLIPFLTFGIEDDSFTYQPVPEWFGDKPIYLHTNFQLSGSGESLTISNPQGNTVDFIEFPSMNADDSYGRTIDGNSNMAFFDSVSPGFSNNNSLSFNGYTEEPVFSLPSGFYGGSTDISIQNYQPGDTIRYTLDGAVPVDTSFMYSEPIHIDSTTVLRARIFKQGFIPGKITTKTYFIDVSSTFPVISISVDPFDLWDWEHGIYVLGPNADTTFPYHNANFWMDWEKSAHIEYFDTSQNVGFDQDIGLKINGGYSRAYPQKSLRILAKGRYGKSTVDYKLFKDKDIYSFKRFILRNSGQDYNVTHFRDAFMHKLIQKETDIDIQDYEPSVVFLNGDYWGVYNIREKIGKYYLNENFGAPEDNISILRDNQTVVIGNNYHYAAMMDYIKAAPVIDSLTVDSISKLLDIDNYTDYFITEMFYVNPDWPNNNIKCWRENNETSKWRYIMTDTDFGFGLYSYVTKNELYRILHWTILYTDNHTPFRRLMENDEYKRYFINRSADMFNTVLHKDNTIALIEQFRQSMEPEMPGQLARWGGDMETWESNVDEMISFAENRETYVRQHYMDEFGLTKLTDLTLEIDSVNHGEIKINTIIPDSLPWTGTYFDGNPVDLTAVPNEGYLFSHWSSNMIISGEDTLKQHLTVNIDTNDIFKAFFVIDTTGQDTAHIIINEINYKSADTLNAGDWVELLNIDTVSRNLSGWIFKDGNDDHQFVIPGQTILDTAQYLILCQDIDLFSEIYPEVENVLGSFDFGLSKNGENLRLYDTGDNLIVSVNYSNEAPWPENVSGTGRTLELLDPNGNLNDGGNWFAGCIGGSPGGPFEECDTIGVNEFYTKNGYIKVFPNPFGDNTTIEFKTEKGGEYNFKVFNSFGNLVREEKSKYFENEINRIEFDRRNLNPGLYFFIISMENRKLKGEFVIK